MSTSAILFSSVASRRVSVESVLSLQGRETDFVRDSTDTEFSEDGQDQNLEYEPCSEPEDEPPSLGDSSGESDNEIITTKVIEVSVRDDGDMEFADSEQTETEGIDSEVDLCDYWRCAQCGATNNNPLYRYCERCFKVRKNFFPPRPKRKLKRKLNDQEETRPLSQDSGVDLEKDDIQKVLDVRCNNSVKRRAESVDRKPKRIRVEVPSDSDTESDSKVVSPLIKTISDPSLTVEDVKASKSAVTDTAADNNLCIVCLTEPKSGVFVHGRIAHICCCYKCAVKVWAKAKRCPVCNCKVSNVLKAVVM